MGGGGWGGGRTKGSFVWLLLLVSSMTTPKQATGSTPPDEVTVLHAMMSSGWDVTSNGIRVRSRVDSFMFFLFFLT